MVLVSSSVKAKFVRDDSRVSRFRNLPSKRGSVSQSSQESSSDVRESLKSKGYVETYNPDSEEFVYSSPQQEFINYQDKKLQTKSNYSSDVVVTDKSGRIVREEKYAPGLVESYGDPKSGYTTIREAKLVEKSIYDYTKGEKTTETFDPTNRNTILASQQIVDNQINRGERPPEPLVIGQRNNLAYQQARKENVKSVSKNLRTGIITKTLYGSTYENVSSSVNRNQYRKQQDFLKQLTPESRQRVLNAKEGSIVIAVDSQNVKDYNKFYNGGAKNEFNKQLRNDNRNNSIMGNSSLFLSKEEKAFQNRIEGIESRKKDFFETERAKRVSDFANIFTQPKFFKDGALISFDYNNRVPMQDRGRVGYVAEGLVQGTLFAGVASGAFVGLGIDNSFAFAEGIVKNKRTRKATVKEIERASDVSNAFLQKQLYPSENALIPIPAGIYNSVATKEGNLFVLGFATSFINPSNVPSAHFLEQIKNTPDIILGKTRTGVKDVITYNKADIKRSSLGVEIVEEAVGNYEVRVEQVPNNPITVGGGKTTKIVVLPDGTQFTRITGSGKFANFFLEAITDVKGFTRNKILYQTGKPTLDTFSIVNDFPRNDRFVNLRNFNTKGSPAIVALEALPSSSSFRQTKGKEVDFLIQEEINNFQGKFAPLQTEGLVVTGKYFNSFEKNVAVIGTSPKLNLNLQQTKSGFDLQINPSKTEFELVEFKPLTEPSSIIKSGEFQKAITFSDLSNIKTPSGGITLFSQSGNKVDLGSYNIGLDRIRLNRNRQGVFEESTPTLYHELGHKVDRDLGFSDFEIDLLMKEVSPSINRIENMEYSSQLKQLGYDPREFNSELVADSIAMFIKDQQSFKNNFPESGDLLSKKLGNEIKVFNEPNNLGKLEVDKAIEYTHLSELRFSQAFEFKIEPFKKGVSEILPSVKGRNNVDKYLLDYQDQLRNPKRNDFKSVVEDITPNFKFDTPAGGLDTARINMKNFIETSLEQFDPYGLSKDRIRNENINELETINQVKVQNPVSNFKFPELKFNIPQDLFPKVSNLRMNSLISSSKNVLKNNLNNDFLNVSKEENISLNISKNFLINESVNESRSINETINNTLNISKSINETINNTLNISKSINLTRNITQNISINKQINLITTFTPPGPPSLFPSPSGSGVEVFDTFVRETRPKKGKSGKSTVREYKVANDVPYNQANSEGAYYVDNSSARSWRIKSVGRKKNVEDIPEASNFFKFRPNKTSGKLKPRYFVEKESYLIDTEGERQEISVKGLLANRRKNRGMVF